MAPMPKKEKVLIGVLIGLIFVLLIILSYAYQKKVWFFSKADTNVVWCGNAEVMTYALEAKIVNEFGLFASGGLCSANAKYALYHLSEKDGQCYLRVNIQFLNCMWQTDPTCKFIEAGERGPYYYYQLLEDNHKLSLIGIGEIPTGTNDVSGGSATSEIIKNYFSYCAKAKANKDKCCPKQAPGQQQQQQQQEQPI